MGHRVVGLCCLLPGRGGVEGLSKKEKGLTDMDNSVVIAGGGGV